MSVIHHVSASGWLPVTFVRYVGLVLQIIGLGLACRAVVIERRYVGLDPLLEGLKAAWIKHVGEPFRRLLDRRSTTTAEAEGAMAATFAGHGEAVATPGDLAPIPEQLKWLKEQSLELRNEIGVLHGQIRAESSQRESGDRESASLIDKLKSEERKQTQRRSRVALWSLVALASGSVLANFASGIAHL